jgi:RNA polymerase sigma factor (sigma-70 family)
MRGSKLHLINDAGNAVAPEIAAAVDAAYRWAICMFPHMDAALLANAAERLARSMDVNKQEIGSPRRYAYASMHGKVRDLQKTRAASEMIMPQHELERLGVSAQSFEDAVERSILFQQLRTKLNQRDRFILILLTERDAGPSHVANALGISIDAATKAIQRVRRRLADCLDNAAATSREKQTQISISKGLTREWT